MRKLQVLLILSVTLRRYTTCYSCGQVRTTLQPSGQDQGPLLTLVPLVPVPTRQVPTGDLVSSHQAAALGHQRPTALHLDPYLSQEEETVVSRRGRGGLTRLDSPPPINRYAGDWSICGRNLLSGQEADYDEVAGSESDAGNPVCTSYTVRTFS